MNDQVAPLLEMSGIVKDFPGVRALDNVDFSVFPGEVHCLLGENGAGKSTLIKIVTGAYTHDAGDIRVKGKLLRHLSPIEAHRNGISAIYQEFQLAPTLTIAENVFLGHEPTSFLNKIGDRTIYRETREAFKKLGFDIDPNWIVKDVGVGLRQITEIVKALMRGGEIVIMDEPSASLNDAEREELFESIERLKSQGIAIIYISHRLDEIFRIGDRASILREGKMVGALRLKDTDSHGIISLMVGRSLEEKFYKTPVPIGDPVLKGDNLTNRQQSVRDFSFTLHAREVLGLTGIRGSGYREAARMIGGAEPIVSGGFTDGEGMRIHLVDSAAAIETGIGYLPEDRKGEGLIMIQSIRNNIVLPVLKRFTSRGLINDRQTGKVAKDYVEELNIRAAGINKQVEFLSGGNQQKVVLSKWLASKAHILVLDAPTQGIDIGAKIEMYKLIAKHVQSDGAIVLVSSELPELLAIADRLLIFRGGVTVAEKLASQTTEEEVMYLAAAGG